MDRIKMGKKKRRCIAHFQNTNEQSQIADETRKEEKKKEEERCSEERTTSVTVQIHEYQKSEK